MFGEVPDILSVSEVKKIITYGVWTHMIVQRVR